MQEYQLRVVEEADALDEKIIKLIAFLAEPKVLNVADPEYARLERQLDAMRLYSYILHNRIKHFLP